MAEERTYLIYCRRHGYIAVTIAVIDPDTKKASPDPRAPMVLFGQKRRITVDHLLAAAKRLRRLPEPIEESFDFIVDPRNVVEAVRSDNPDLVKIFGKEAVDEVYAGNQAARARKRAQPQTTDPAQTRASSHRDPDDWRNKPVVHPYRASFWGGSVRTGGNSAF